MANWSVKATAVATDQNAKNGNLIVTFTATNSVTGEVVTRQVASDRWTSNKAKGWAENIVDELNTRDAAIAVRDSLLPSIQAFINTNTVLATG